MNKSKYRVYQDPITKNEYEGDCIILEIIRQEIGTYEKNKFILAYVKFDDDLESEYIRTVDLKDKIVDYQERSTDNNRPFNWR